MSEDSSLSRWSQRKLAARQGGALPEPDEIASNKERVPEKEKKPFEPALAPAGPPGTAAPGKEEMLTEADLPPIEELSAQSDYTAFLKQNVPEALRRRALRKLWVSDPVLANLDGLNDYDDDYSVVQAMTMDDTIYKLGRGLLGDGPESKDAETAAENVAEEIAHGEPELAYDSAAKSGVTEIAGNVPGVPGDNDAPTAVDGAPTGQAGKIDPRGCNEPGPAGAKSGADSDT